MLIAGTPEFQLLTLVIMRMTGCILFNPFFSRRNIPAMFKAGLIIALSIIVTSFQTYEMVEIYSPIAYAVLLIKELFIGYVLGLTMYIFEMVPLYAGSIADMQMGMSMATVYDANSGAQIALSSNILQIYYTLLFFVVDGHLALLKIFMLSGDVVGYGQVTLNPEAIDLILIIFMECIVLAVKLVLPIIGFEFIMEVSIGLLMRIIPQINLFVLSIQLRVLSGVTILLFLISPIGEYLLDVSSQMVKNLQIMLQLLS